MADKQILDLTLENNPPRDSTFLEVQETTEGSKYIALQTITGNDVKIINTIDDFPAPAAGVITLAADTAYFIADKITHSERFVLADDSNFFGYGGGSELEYTGSGTMFTGNDTKNTFRSVKLTCTDAAAVVFDVDGSGGAGQSLELQQVSVPSCNRFVESTDVSVNMTRCSIIATTSGVRFSGTLQPFFLCEITFIGVTGTSGICVDFASVVMANIIADLCTFAANASGGRCFKSTAAANGNLNEGSLANIRGVDFFSTTDDVWLDGLDEDDVRWNYQNCNNIADSETDGLLAFSGNSTATSISGADTPALVAGTWTVVDTKQMTGTTAGRLTTDSERKNVHLNVNVALGVYPDGGGTKDVTVYIYKNGPQEADSATQFETTGSKPAYISIPCAVVFNPADPVDPTYVEVYIENNTDGTDLIVSSAKLRVG